jgi:hypothetical protein
MFVSGHIRIIHPADTGSSDDFENPTKHFIPLSIYTNDSWKISRNNEDGIDEVMYSIKKCPPAVVYCTTSHTFSLTYRRYLITIYHFKRLAY